MWQDNDPKHSSRSTSESMKNKIITIKFWNVHHQMHPTSIIFHSNTVLQNVYINLQTWGSVCRRWIHNCVWFMLVCNSRNVSVMSQAAGEGHCLLWLMTTPYSAPTGSKPQDISNIICIHISNCPSVHPCIHLASHTCLNLCFCFMIKIHSGYSSVVKSSIQMECFWECFFIWNTWVWMNTCYLSVSSTMGRLISLLDKIALGCCWMYLCNRRSWKKETPAFSARWGYFSSPH